MEAAIAGVAAWIGSGAVATFVASVAVYAAVGAVIGGVTAAVMGGDIGKGMLFGAVGGAITGGISGALANVGTSAGGQLAAGASATSKTLTPALMEAKAAGMGVAATKAGAGGAAAFLSSDLAPVLAQGAIGMAGSALEGQGLSEEAEKNRKFEMEKMDKLHEQNLETIAAQQAGGGGGGGASDNSIKVAELNNQLRREELAEQRRQYDVARQDAIAKVETRKSALMGMRASRKKGGALQGVEGIDRQGNKDIPGLFGEVTVDDSLVPIEGEKVVNAQGEEEQPYYGQGGV